MFGPVKAITGGALVFALGGLFLIAQPFDWQTSVPGAEQGAGPANPVEVTITASDAPDLMDTEEVCTGARPQVCTFVTSERWSATDPRLSGAITYWVNEHWWPNYAVLGAEFIELVNDEGRWVGTGRLTGPLEDLYVFTLAGDGSHEGLTAVLTSDLILDDDDSVTYKGVIIDGGLPPFPEPAE